MATRGEKQTEARSGRETSGTTDRRGGQASSADTERAITTSDENAQRQRTEATALAREGARGTSVARRPNVFRAAFPATPWELMRRMSEELDQLVETLGTTRTGIEPGSLSGPAARTGTRRGMADLDVTGTVPWVPQIDVIRRSDEMVVRADLPGIKADEVEVSVDEGLLTIRGERQEEVLREEREGLVRSERRYGAFYRAIPLPEGADENGISANFRNGVLEITVPLSAEERGRRIAVQP